MPIEIRELVIKVTVEENKKGTDLNVKELDEVKNKWIKECIEKIMVLLENSSER